MYFASGLLAYAISFLQCAAVILVFDSAQPVLLYIVPSVFLATFVTAIYRDEWDKLWTVDIKAIPTKPKKLKKK